MASWVVERPERLILDGSVDQVDVTLFAGRVNVVATDDGAPRLEVSRIGRKRLLVDQEGGVLRVRHEPRRWPLWFGMFLRQYRCDVSIAVPRAAGGHLRVASGSVVASGLAGATRIDVTSGRVTLLGMAGSTSASTVSGPIEALGVAGDLHLETVSGEITLADSSARRVRARAVSGAITCDLDNPYDSEVRLDTTSGEITARVREDSDLDLDLHAVSGRVTSGFAELPRTDSHTLRGRLGAGTGSLSANAVSGNISLLRRPVDYDDAGEPES
jgi:DUF4097 and DUF4098 domain-containing protein YvlB